MTEDPVFSQGRRVWGAETPAFLQMEPEKEESVGRRLGDESCGSGPEARAGYLDSGGSIFGGCGCGHVSTYSMVGNKELKTPLSGKFGFFVGGHERRRQSKRPQAEASLRASAHIMNQGHCPLVQLLLIVILILDHVQVHEVAKIRTGIPSGVVGIHVDFS